MRHKRRKKPSLIPSSVDPFTEQRETSRSSLEYEPLQTSQFVMCGRVLRSCSSSSSSSLNLQSVSPPERKSQPQEIPFQKRSHEIFYWSLVRGSTSCLICFMKEICNTLLNAPIYHLEALYQHIILCL